MEAVFPEVTLAIRERNYKVTNTFNRSIFRLGDKRENVIRRPA